MSGHGAAQQERIMESFCALVAQRVHERLPVGHRGIRALDPIRGRVPEAVEAALEEIVARIAAEVRREVPFQAELPTPADVDGTLRLLDNDKPCTTCHRVARVATVEVRAGMVVGVTCESCEKKP